MTKNINTTFILIALFTNFLVISNQLALMQSELDKDTPTKPTQYEPFSDFDAGVMSYNKNRKPNRHRQKNPMTEELYMELARAEDSKWWERTD